MNTKKCQKICAYLHKKYFGGSKEKYWCSHYDCEVKVLKCKMNICNRKEK